MFSCVDKKTHGVRSIVRTLFYLKKKIIYNFFFVCVRFEDFGVNFLVFKVNGQQIEGCMVSEF